MTRTLSPKVAGYAAFAALSFFAGLALGLPELVVAGAPFALVASLGVALARAPVVDVRLELGRDRLLEGEETELTLAVSSSTGVERFELLLALPAGIDLLDGTNPVLLRVPRGGERTLRLRVGARRWGGYAIGVVHLRARDLLGVHRYESALDRRVPLKVFPAPQALRTLPRPRETQVSAGNQVARARGDGIEFADLRPFAPGDVVRRVNWRASARRGELWVNEHHPERNADVILFLDSFAEATRDGRSTLDLGVRATASLAERYLREKDRVGFVSFGGVLRWLVPATGRSQLYRIVDAVLDSRIILNYAWKDIAVIPRRMLPPKALILALSPLLDERSVAALLDLRGRGFDLAVVELSPVPFAAGDDLATRLWRLRRDALRARYERAGVPISVWGEDGSLNEALEEVTGYRRFARSGR